MAKNNLNNNEIKKLVEQGRRDFKKYGKSSKKNRVLYIIGWIIIAIFIITQYDIFNFNTVKGNINVVKDEKFIPKSRDNTLIKEKINIKDYHVVDGDTFTNTKTKQSYRLYYVDTPESCILKNNVSSSKNSDNTCKDSKLEEKNGKEASLFMQDIFNEADSLTIEYSKNKKDRYDRYLVWLFLDDKYLVQSMISNNNLIDGFYDYNGRFDKDGKKTNGFFKKYTDLVLELGV
ncbi:thermonuclease family protein [Mycoplasma sp. P36-A1]|uniref:thermonuclease family protein n=1 Tax=Mycoplasma sp. P36-A1 TaxID=3252900 RepID=UPI003C2DF84D